MLDHFLWLLKDRPNKIKIDTNKEMLIISNILWVNFNVVIFLKNKLLLYELFFLKNVHSQKVSSVIYILNYKKYY